LNNTKTYNYAPLQATYHSVLIIQPVTLTHCVAAGRQSSHHFYSCLLAVAVDWTLMVQSVMLHLGVRDKFKSSTNFHSTNGRVNAFYCNSCTDDFHLHLCVGFVFNTLFAVSVPLKMNGTHTEIKLSLQTYISILKW